MRYKHALMLLLAAAACTRGRQGAPQAAPAHQPEDTVAEGTVRLVGPSETAQVVLSGGTLDVALVGPLSGELARLAGARVRVAGRGTANPGAVPADAMEVAEYEVVSVDGRKPIVGIIVLREGGLWLAGQDTVQVVGAPPELAGHVGAKAFIVGTPEGRGVRVQSYGILRDPPR